MVASTLTVRVLTEGVHSGAAGGIVPSSFRLLRRLIGRVEDAGTGKLVDVLEVPIPASVRHLADAVAGTPMLIASFGLATPTPAPWHRQTWCSPTRGARVSLP